MAPSFESFTLLSQAVAVHVRQRNPKGTPAVLFLHGWLDHSTPLTGCWSTCRTHGACC
jgi:hypothetical protein